MPVDAQWADAMVADDSQVAREQSEMKLKCASLQVEIAQMKQANAEHDAAEQRKRADKWKRRALGGAADAH